MTEHFNGLTEAEQERLALLMEECSEVIHMGCKILRHGYESYNPNDLFNKTANRTNLEREIEDVLSCIKRMVDEMDIDIDAGIAINSFTVLSRITDKAKYLHHQQESQ